MLFRSLAVPDLICKAHFPIPFLVLAQCIPPAVIEPPRPVSEETGAFQGPCRSQLRNFRQGSRLCNGRVPLLCILGTSRLSGLHPIPLCPILCQTILTYPPTAPPCLQPRSLHRGLESGSRTHLFSFSGPRAALSAMPYPADCKVPGRSRRSDGPCWRGIRKGSKPLGSQGHEKRWLGVLVGSSSRNTLPALIRTPLFL